MIKEQSKYKRFQQSLYIPPEKIDSWNEIRAEAKAERQGIAWYIISVWEKAMKREVRK